MFAYDLPRGGFGCEDWQRTSMRDQITGYICFQDAFLI